MTPDPRPEIVRIRARWAFALVVSAAFSATAIQVDWMERVKAWVGEEAGTSRSAVPAKRLFEAVTRTVDPFAAAFAAICLFAFVEVVRMAWKQTRAPGGPAALLPRSALGRVVLLLVATWVFVRWHAAPGVMAGFDVDLHVSTVALAAQEISLGHWPAWTDAWYLGFPLCQYYGGLYYVPAAALAVLLGGDVRVGSKIVLAAWHLAAAPSAYLLAREVGASRGASLVSGIAYAACPYFGATLAWVGSLTAAPVIALAPAVLRFAIRAGRGADLPASSIGWGLCVGFLVWAHPAYAVQVAVLSVIAAALAGGRRVMRRAFAFSGVVAAFSGVLASLPVLVSHLRGYPRPGAVPGFGYFLLPHVPDLGLLGRSLRWSVTWPGAVGGYVGVIGLALGVAGLVLMTWRGRLRFWPLVAVVVLLWTGGGFYQSRALLLLPVVLLPGLALAVDSLSARAPRLAVVAVALLALDLAAGNLFSPYRADLEGFQAALSDEARTQGQGRTLLLSKDRHGTYTAGEWQVGGEAPLRTLTGGFREAAPATYPALLSLLDRTAHDPSLDDGLLARDLALHGVTSIRVLEGRRVLPPSLQVEARLRAAAEPAPTSEKGAGDHPTTNVFLWAPALALASAGWLVSRRLRAQVRIERGGRPSGTMTDPREAP